MDNIQEKQNINQAAKYMLIASFLFAFTGGFAKELSSYMSSIEIVFFRNVTGVILILLAIYKSPLKQVGGKPLLLFFRGFIGFSALLMYFYNIAHIPLAEAITFSKLSPIFTALFSYIFLKENLNRLGWGGVFLGFFGIMFITGFDITSLDKTDWLGILSGIGAGLAYTSIRELKKYYDNRAIVLSFMLIGTIGPVILLTIGEFYSNSSIDWIVAKFVMPTGFTWFLILGLGLSATLMQIYMTKAYSLAKGGIIGTIGYSNIIFSIIIGMFLGDNFPDNIVLFGIVFIILSGVLVTKK
ncbi:MAG: DMT family transporter [Campylobacterota bacterium]|nr:DMT family transporter [Campylobacterota bacterium]